jgi:M6 family metalloprotease-like protein
LANTIIASLASKYTLSDYDANDDGYLDGFEMVYKSSYEWDGETASTEVWWNYTGFDDQGAGTVSSPKCGLFFFSEFTMISNGYYNPDIDCHTLIHESGHMLGLDDYYSYDDSPKEYPCGMADMMDHNIGDHNAFSKMLLGWVSPWVVDGTSSNFSITLNSFADTGDCILLRNTSSDPWNGTPYDEYLILQYFTPTNLNYLDSVNGYPEFSGAGTGGLYKKAGLQVFHVDARTINLAVSSYSKLSYSDKIDENSMIVASNTGSTSINVSKTASSGDWAYDSPYRLIKAIPATGKDIFSGSNGYNYLGYQKALFGTSAFSCGSTTYTNSSMSALFTNGTKFNDGSTLDYSFSVTAQSDSTITLAFNKI